jgi:hypothetical protein
MDVSFVLSACGEVLEQLDADDYVRWGQIEAIVSGGDPMQKIKDLVKFLVDYTRSLVGKTKDGSVNGPVPVSRKDDQVKARVNEREVEVSLRDRTSVEGRAGVVVLSLGQGKEVVVPNDDSQRASTSELPFRDPTW